MNKIVREHYPVEKLPDDISKHFPKGASVTLEVSEEDTGARRRPLSVEETVKVMRESQERHRGSGVTIDTIAAEVRTLRDEWDD